MLSENKVSVSYDLSQVKIGESIFSKDADNNVFTLCVKLSDLQWRVYKYENRRGFSSNIDSKPDYYIYHDNEIFDEEKTSWVSKYWNGILSSLNSLDNFESSMKYNFH